MALKAGRVGVSSDMVDPVNGKVVGEKLSFPEGIMSNEELTEAVAEVTKQYTNKNAAIESVAVARIDSVGKMCVCSLDFTVGSNNIPGWTDDLISFGTGYSSISIYGTPVRDVTDGTKSSMETALIKTGGGLSMSKSLTAGHRYQLNIVFINRG